MGVKCVQFTTGDKVTSSKEPKYSGSVWIQKSLCVSYKDTPQGMNCCRETQAHTITAHVLAWHHPGVMAPRERQETGICLPFHYTLKNKLKSSFHLICIKLKSQK